MTSPDIPAVATCPAPCEGTCAPDLLRLADYKWLVMACDGQRIDLGRMQADRGYAEACVRQGLTSPNEVVRRCAAALLRCLVPGERAVLA